MAPSSNQEPSGSWDSIHVFESSERGRQAHYKLTSTIMLQLTTHQASEEGGENGKRPAGVDAVPGNAKHKDIQYKRKGEVTLSGSMTRQVCVFSPHHGFFCSQKPNTLILVGAGRTWSRRIVFHSHLQSCCSELTERFDIPQQEQDWPIHDPSSHINNTGRMIEEMEIKMRNSLQEVRPSTSDAVAKNANMTYGPWVAKVYFGKTRDIVYDLRSVDDLERARRQRELQKELVGFIKR